MSNNEEKQAPGEGRGKELPLLTRRRASDKKETVFGRDDHWKVNVVRIKGMYFIRQEIEPGFKPSNGKKVVSVVV